MHIYFPQRVSIMKEEFMGLMYKLKMVEVGDS